MHKVTENQNAERREAQNRPNTLIEYGRRKRRLKVKSRITTRKNKCGQELTSK